MCSAFGLGVSESPQKNAIAVKVIYVCHEYPTVSQTFVFSELNELKRIHGDVDMYAIHLRRPARKEKLTFKPNFLSGILFLVTHPRTTFSTVNQARFEVLGVRDFLTQCFAMLHAASFSRQITAKYPSGESLHIHAHFFGRTLEVASMAKSLLPNRNVKVSVTGHASDVSAPANRIRTKRMASGADLVIAASQRVNEDVIRLIDKPSDLIVHCGVSLNDAPPSTRKTKNFQVVSVGRMIEKKGFDICLAVARALVERRVNFNWVFIGDGPQLSTLKNMQKAFDLDDGIIQWLGPLSNSDVKKIVSESDLMVLPSRRTASGDEDGIPVVLMEAMSVLTPVVASDVGGISELVLDKITGFMVKENSPEELTTLLQSIILGVRDSKEVAQNGFLHIQNNFSTVREAEKLLDAFLNLHEAKPLT